MLAPRRVAPLVLVLVLAAFQFQQRPWGRGGWRAAPDREGLPTNAWGSADRGFTFCRLLYRSVRSEPLGHGWNTDYPTSDHNFMLRLSQLTVTPVSRWSDGALGHAVVRPSQDELYQCPFLFASDVGTAGFDELEVVRLRDYLLKGGFLYVDDFWGPYAWQEWQAEILRILPGMEIVDVGPEHPLMQKPYLIPEVPQVPSIQYWRRQGRTSTSEQGWNSAEPHLRAIFDEYGRALVIMTHNTDIADGWEREGEDEDFFYTFSPEAYAVGINILLYMMTH